VCFVCVCCVVCVCVCVCVCGVCVCVSGYLDSNGACHSRGCIPYNSDFVSALTRGK